jgi:hypothetical protein
MEEEKGDRRYQRRREGGGKRRSIIAPIQTEFTRIKCVVFFKKKKKRKKKNQGSVGAPDRIPKPSTYLCCFAD